MRHAIQHAPTCREQKIENTSSQAPVLTRKGMPKQRDANRTVLSEQGDPAPHRSKGTEGQRQSPLSRSELTTTNVGVRALPPLSTVTQGAMREPWSARAPIGRLAQGAPANCVGGTQGRASLRTHSHCSRFFRKLFCIQQFSKSQISSREKIGKLFRKLKKSRKVPISKKSSREILESLIEAI